MDNCRRLFPQNLSEVQTLRSSSCAPAAARALCAPPTTSKWPQSAAQGPPPGPSPASSAPPGPDPSAQRRRSGWSTRATTSWSSIAAAASPEWRTRAGRRKGGACSGCSWGAPAPGGTYTPIGSRSSSASPTSPWAASFARSSTPSRLSTSRSSPPHRPRCLGIFSILCFLLLFLWCCARINSCDPFLFFWRALVRNFFDTRDHHVISEYRHLKPTSSSTGAYERYCSLASSFIAPHSLFFFIHERREICAFCRVFLIEMQETPIDSACGLRAHTPQGATSSCFWSQHTPSPRSL